MACKRGKAKATRLRLVSIQHLIGLEGDRQNFSTNRRTYSKANQCNYGVLGKKEHRLTLAIP